MRSFLKKSLLIIGLMVGALFVMSAELVTAERHTLGVQIEQSVDIVSIDIDEVVALTALDCTGYIPTINEAEVEISYGIYEMVATSFIENNYQNEHYVNRSTAFTEIRLNSKAQKQKCTRLDLKRAGTAVIYGVYIDTLYDNRKSLNQAIVKSGEVRIRGKPSLNKTV